ncbi:MAG TPA: Do family serine endopeptidase [Devosiaceae bacterium]|nr:Do family serine endopeptidase [Devosiaceae bacterium]
MNASSLPCALRAALAGALLVLSFGPAPALAQAMHGPVSVADLAALLTPTVVNISSTRRLSAAGRGVPFPRVPQGVPLEEFLDQLQPDEGQQGPSVSALGSGFIIDATGLIATNNHVIEGADEIVVLFPDGKTVQATVVGADEKTDLAVLRIDVGYPLPVAPLGDSNNAQIGDWVMAIGSPFGLGGSVSLGIVSARNRDINSGPYDAFIQTDAAINQGNSGGPLFDMKGEVVGINTAIIANSGRSLGVGFAVPINLARPVLEQLIEFGETRRGWIGVGIQDVTQDIAASLALDSTEGALVLSVTPDGPSDGALREGDIILEFDGKQIAAMRDLPRVVAETAVGKRVDVLVIRSGAEITVEVELGLLQQGELRVSDLGALPPPDEMPPVTGDLLGLEVSALTDELRKQHAINADTDGVVITAVDPESDAYEKGIRPGLMIAEINQQPITAPEDVATIIGTAMDTGREAVLLMLADASGSRRFVAVRVVR